MELRLPFGERERLPGAIRADKGSYARDRAADIEHFLIVKPSFSY
jgi:hypothetical protein